MIPLQNKNEFKLTREELEAAITPRTKILVLPFPNNPTGSIMTREDLEPIAEVVKEHDLFVISDEKMCIRDSIRAEQKRDGAVFSICARGIVEHANEKLEIFGFCMKHGSCETVSLGELLIVHGSVSQMVETEERLDGLDGILIKCEEKVLYAAVWEPVKVNLDVYKRQLQDGIWISQKRFFCNHDSRIVKRITEAERTCA